MRLRRPVEASPVSTKEQERVVREWAKTEEVALPPSEVEPIVSQLIELAKYARSTNRGMYLWGSL